MPSPEVARARYLRHNMTGVEARLWSRLRARQQGFKFRRQHPIGPYIADFACVSAHLAVEIDGETHREADDIHRDTWLESRGWRVLRVSVQEVDENLDSVVENVWFELNSPGSAIETRRAAVNENAEFMVATRRLIGPT